MTTIDNGVVTALVDAATAIGARPFKGATGDWAGAVELALLDTILSIGANVNGVYGAGVLPRLRAFKAFRGPANMMRVLATLGPIGLADFVAEKHQLQMVLHASGALLDAGVNTADDVEPASAQQTAALTGVAGVPDSAWAYFLFNLGHDTEQTRQLRAGSVESFVTRVVEQENTEQENSAQGSNADHHPLLTEVAARLDEGFQRKSFGQFPRFTPDQLIQGIVRSEYARQS